MFPNFLVKHSSCIVSDHCLIMMDTKGLMRSKHKKSKNRFKFEAFCAKERECESIIKEVWCKSENVSMREKMKQTGDQLL